MTYLRLGCEADRPKGYEPVDVAHAEEDDEAAG